MNRSIDRPPAGRAAGGERTILDVLRLRAESRPLEVVFTFVAGDGTKRSITFGQLHRRAGEVASHLAEAGLRGERILLLHPAGPEFIEAFFGCLMAGAIAVPAFPPRANRTLERLASMAADSGAAAALTPASLRERCRAIAATDPRLASLRFIESEGSSGAGGAAAAPVEADSLAYLQYTSGSTSEPKGVMIRHANLMANSEEIRRGFRHGTGSRSLCWLPHYHDMGLVDGLIQPVYSGFPAVLMDPARFLQNPARWLEAISDHAITHSGAPNFAYDLCARRVDPDPARIDLRSWEVAYNGAEPVRAETLDRFASRFAPCGFRREAFYPAYGLAEATLKVAGGRRGEGARLLRVSRTALEAGRAEEDVAGQQLVSSGRAEGDTILRIVDPESGRPLPDGAIGEIWVSGGSVAGGYWGRPEESEATFGARLPGERRPFLRTGDLGFLHAGDIVVTGRAKDMLIVRGRNIYPQDIEATAAASDARLRPAGGAAFGVEIAGEERLVVVHEVDRRIGAEAQRIVAALRAAIVETHEIDPWAIILVGPAGVPRTSSGKVRRSACRLAFLSGALPEIAAWRAPEARPDAGAPEKPAGPRAWLESRIAAKLGVAPGAIVFDQPLARFGIDSLRSIELAHEIEAAFGVHLPAADLLAAASLDEIVARVESGSREGSSGAPADPAGLEECPLSSGQLALWFIHEMAPESAAYTIASALRITGPLDGAALQRALRQLVARHASLRARIVGGGGSPRQRFDVTFDSIWSTGDLRGVPPGLLPERLADEAYRPFDLERGPLFRAALLQSQAGPILLISAHHAVADLWSLSIVLRDLQAHYAAEIGDASPGTAPPPHPAEFVRWQAGLAGGEAGERRLARWRDRLSGEIPALDLPSTRRRPAARSFRGGVRTLRLDPALASALRDLARASGVTLYTLLLAAWQAFLRRITGQRDILVGSPASGRTSARFSGLVAYLVNPVVLRADFREDPRFEDLIQATRDRLHEALENQDFPFATIVKRLAPPREPGRSPFFDVMFELRAAGSLVRGDLAAPGTGARAELGGGVAVEPIEIERRTAQFDLSTTVTDDGDTLSLELEYDADLFDPGRVDDLARSFTTLLGGVVADPGVPVSRLPLLSAHERASALGPRTAAAGEEPRGCIHRLFEAHAARRPGATAAVHRGEKLTYGELNRRANLLARRLRSRGVGVEARVALSLEKSLDLLVALLAVLKAGGAYVPIAPALPSARKRFMAGDAGVTLALAREGAGAELGVEVLPVDGGPGPPEGDPRSQDLEESPPPESLAYIIYTSGTTGTPKGVCVSHASLLGAYRAWDRAYGLESLSVHLQMAGPGFDVFTGDLVRALGSGAMLVLCDRETLLDPPALAALAREHGAQIGDFVPATLRELGAHLAATGERLDSFRIAAIGSDAWSMTDYRHFREVFGAATQVLNSYGVTEATIDSAFGAILPEDAARPSPPIGRPMANTLAYVLDENLEPVPAGVRGGLYLGGPAVARGYAGRPDLTAASFLPDPHAGGGARMYRTGDAARRLEDGRIEFAGRDDSQVKIRGYRVEPAEIEAVLASHTEVRACAVVARERGPVRRLVAYVVPERGRPEIVRALQDHTAERLPDYMVPSAFVLLEALPLTANGKIDRRALPEPSWSGTADPAGGDPGTDEERILAGIWQRVLGVDRVGRHDNFFTLGGDSILAIQVVARAREAGLRIAPRLLFENPTVAGLAGSAARHAGAEASGAPRTGTASAIRPGTGEHPLLPLQHWFFEQRFADPDHWHMALALDARESLDAATARIAVRALLDHHDALRARFIPEEGRWRQVIDPPGSGEAGLIETRAAPGGDAEEAVTECARLLGEEIRLERGPLIRFGIARGADGEGTTLVVVAHHLAVDGVSLRLITEDFDRAYRQALEGRPVDLPAASTTAAEWAEQLTAAVREGRLGGAPEAWSPPEAPGAAASPFGRSVIEPTEVTSAFMSIDLDEARTDDLIAAAAARGVPVESLLLAALASAWTRWTGSPDLDVELEGHGRDTLPDLDVSRTVGWFTETRPIHIDRIDPSDAGATLREVARALRAAPAPGFDARRYLSPGRAGGGPPSRLPAPAISFNYLGRFEATLEAAPLFARLREPSGPRRSPRARRTHALEIDASVVGGRLSIRWSYSRAQLEADEIERLAASVREALDALAPAGAVAREEIEDVLPLMPMQEGMLFHHLRGGDHDPYVAQIALDLEGAVDAEILARGWQSAVDVHPALRTEFAWKGGDDPVRIVKRRARLPIAIHDGDDATAEAVMVRARAGGFDVAQAPLARLDLVRKGGGKVTAIFTHHHLLLDGWSLPFVLGTAFEACEALAEGRPKPPHVEPSHRPYAAWLSGREPAAAERFFRDALSGFTTPTPAPESLIRTGEAGSGVARASALEGVEMRARALGLTPNTVVQAAWALVLAGCSGSRDVLFGATSSGRHPEVAGIGEAVGLFINTLPMRVSVDPKMSALEWMRGIQRRGAELRQYEHAPLAAVQRWAPTPPNTPLFESLLVFENYPIDLEKLARRRSFSVTGVRLHEETNYPLTIVTTSENGLRFRALYDRGRYDEAAVGRVLDRLRAAMEGLLTRPDGPIGEISVLSEVERRRLVEEWNQTRRDYPRDSTITEVFEAIARDHAGRIALASAQAPMTYAALLERATLLAQSLRAKGVGIETRVALAMDRSPDHIAAILGVFFAGGAYVPIDPDAPAGRIRKVLAAAGAALVVCDSHDGRPDTEIPAFTIAELLADRPRDGGSPLPRPLPDGLAYVMFTSGSTGEPKGIEVSHRNVLRLVLGADYVRFGPEQTILLLSSIAFDVSTFEIWGALLHGGRLAVPPPGVPPPGEIARLIDAHGVTTLWLTSALFHLVVDEEAEALARVSQVLAGGDIVSPERVRRLLAAGCRRFVDGYGPTEATVFACCAPLSPGEDFGESVPIGRPIANTRVYVLDEAMRLLPIGAPGELYIGGDGVARGYAGRPDLTAERFVPDPFGPPGSRLYRTGDLVRWRREGRLDFIGRRDGQVKVRGFRVEIGDVEAALSRLPGVKEAAVVARDDGTATGLVGYVVPAAGGERDAGRLRLALAEQLPRYMIPTRLVFLEAMPLNASGKIDRKALPAPCPDGTDRPRQARLASAEEEAAADAWRQILGVNDVGPEDDFFEIGGHSLHATRVVARLRRLLGVELPLRDLFDAPTLRGFARRIEAARRASMPPIRRAPEEERRKASYAQRRLWFLDRLEPGSAAYNIAAALRIEGPLDGEALARALSGIVSRHEALRTRFEEGPEGPLQIVEPPLPIVLPLDDLTGLAPEAREGEAARRSAAVAREPFDLARGPLLRAQLLRLADQDHVFALAVHHIAADGWSIGVLVHELAAAYQAAMRGEEPSLPGLPVQYADWAAWQRAWLEGGEMERQLSWWRGELAGLEPLALPADRPRPARPTYAGATIDVRLEGDLVERLTSTATAEGATLSMALLTAFAAVLGKWSGQSDFGIGTPVANRTREESEPLIGFFVNSLVIRARLEGDRLTYRELLARIREAALGAYANQDVPFERVVEALQPDRDLSRTPLFQVMLILQNTPMGALDLGGARLTPFEAPTGTSTFDVTISLEPAGAAPGAEEPAGGLGGSIEYSTELFDEATVRRLWDHFLRILRLAAEDPDADLRRVSLLSSEDRARAIEVWSGRGDLAATGPPVHERFAAIAARRPERIAAIHGERRLTYGELDDRSARLAALLSRHGAGPEERVGLCVERSPEMLVGMMATLRAGAAFVPLDPDHPRERLSGALDDAGVRVVLATRASAPLAEGKGRSILLLDEEGTYAGEPMARSAGASPESLAYVIYTSGTTGRPKGVMISHGALSAAYAAWERLYGLEAIRSHLQMAGIAFDVCTGDVVRALCSGGTLVFCNRETLLDPGRLFDLALRERIEFAEFVPAVLRQVAAHARARPERLESVRVAAVGSDVWTSAEVEGFRSVFGPRTRIANSYGVTEATIDSTCWFDGDGEGAGGSPPIGRPLAHTTAYVLDENLEPAPPGVSGELYLGGPAVARGYAGRPEQTAERFVPDPFGGAGARLYRTGDRARYLADGRIAFAGRSDDQVKIRGQRIEPAEVEAALASQGAVAACAVAARKAGDGSARLAAWVVPRESGGFDPGESRRLLRERLPEAMVPAAITVMEALPLTPNGKVDRRRLPEPDWEALRTFEPPRTAAEAAIAEAFAQVLGLASVGAGDDFFALGGHSLLATRVVSRLRAPLGVEVPVRALFEAPTVRALAARVESLGVAPAPPPILPAAEPERRRPSYAQRRLWFIDRLEPGTAAYNLPSSILLDGDLDVPALERALSEVVRRHEALRTCFVEGPEGPEQVIASPEPIALEIDDLSALPGAERAGAADRLLREEARRPFDLSRGPLLRARLLRLEPRRHALLVTVHHIAADGWSLVVLVREMGALYGARMPGGVSPLPPLEVQYADWAAWQRAWLEGGEMERQLAWWRTELEGVGTLALPGDRPRHARPSYSGAALDVRIGRHLRERLEGLARAQGATLHMALLAGYAAALGKWSGQRDFAVGTPVANRRSAEAEPLIGFFVNTLAVRVRLGGRGLSFRGLLDRLRETALGAHANQDVPFERVVEELSPERYFGHNPLFQTLFALQNVPVGKIEMPGLSLTYEEPETGITRYDLEFFLAETPEGLDGLINYSTEIFDRSTIERFVENLQTLLEAAVEEPDRALSDLPALAPGQLRRVLREWNAAREPYPDPPLVHTLFERRAASAPEAPAVRFGGARLSYGQLDERANRLARHLVEEGIGTEDLIAVCLERSFDMIVALLATMKAGAAYVPVDPDYPRDRIALILEEAGARAVLTQEHLAERLGGCRARLIRLDAVREAVAREEGGPPPAGLSPDALVYAVYTSGSTGRPKGVAMTHRAISNLLSFQRRDSAACGALRTLQFAPLSFDVSFQEIFSTLTAGGEIVIVSEEERRDAARLLRIIAETGIERLFVPFVALNQLAEAARSEAIDPGCLREIDTAGEQLRITPAIRDLFRRLPGCRLVNHYGPSETHLVTTFVLEGDPLRWPDLPPIGRPIPNAPVYLLDAQGQPVPIGAPGEIYVGGAGLARGYHSRPDRTAELFVPDPFSGEAGARAYRTGDMARFLPDGLLEFLGRRDLQVKIRGYRVEPGEIEAALARHPAVRQAAVRAHEHPGGRRLAAYVALRDGAHPDGAPAELKEHLAATLPEFMVPAAIVVLDALPLTPSGKVDRNRLPEPAWGALAGRVAPRTPEEEVVCAIVAEVLEVASVGAEDDFFELGGHSLLATQVISRVRRAFGAEVPLRALFESPTPAAIAAAAIAARGAGAPALPPLRAAAPQARSELSHAQRRLWFLDRLGPGTAAYNLPAAVRLEGELDAAALGRALAEIIRRHEALRTRFVEGPLGPEQVVDPPGELSLEVEDLGASPAETRDAEARLRIASEAARPFDLARGPLLRARLLKLGPREHLLSLTLHHIAADGWSLGVLLREIGALYGAFAEGRPSPLPDLPVQYADWAAWQRDGLRGGELDRQIDWWRGELAGAPPALDLPTDRARPAEASWSGATLPVRLPGDLRRSLLGLARSEGATLHMVLLAGYAWMLMAQSGQSEVVVGTPVANRRSPEAELLIGFFVNTLPVRVRGGGSGLTWRELIARVREASLGAYASQDVPFERIVEEIQPVRTLNRAPIFQAAFALQNARLPEIDLPGLRMTPAEIDTSTAKFDLMLVLEEERDGGISGAFEYNTDIFDTATIERLSEVLGRALRRAAEAPDAPVAETLLLLPVEERRIVVDWNPVARDADEPLLLHEMVELQAGRTPDDPALALGGDRILYADLDRRANRLARHLRDLGAGPESRVAILLERSPEAIVAMLGVLKAGAAYVPLDPGEPASRLRYFVEDCGAAIVLTERRFAEAVEPTGARVVLLDRDSAAISRLPSERPACGARPANLAYVLYTSGSTGRPKGVGVEHRQIAGYVASVTERLRIRAGWSFALVSTLAADLGNTVIYPALATGGCLHILPPDLAFDAPGAEAWFGERAIDCLKIVPSHLQALQAGTHPSRVMPRRLLVLGGEATRGAYLETLGALSPGCRVANHYGPTEATVGAVAGLPVDADALRAAAPLGRPLDNARAYVLDPLGRPLPAGVPGGLHLGGACVTRGYMGRADLTAERFLPDPFSGRPGARMYRTGDRARWLHDGRLEFIGREDAQVKIRGFRVEPGEIESAIAEQPEVRRAAVVAREEAGGGSRLIAYVVPEPRHSPTIHGLPRRRLASGIAIAELNRNESDYLHREIFETGAYVRHGITLREGDTILDVGANIGLFSIFASLACASARLYAFEPNPHLQGILRANAAAYAPAATIFDVGLADREGEGAFTFFPGFSLLSGLHADAATEKQVVRSFLESQAQAGVEGAAVLAREADALLDERFEGRTIGVRLRTLSGVIAEQGIDRIGLLKVNVEKSELEVLRGIREEDWTRIDQTVVEVDRAESLAPIVGLLEAHGFEVLVEQDPLLERTDLRYVYAARLGSGRALARGAPPSIRLPELAEPLLTPETLRARLGRALPAALVPAAWVLLEDLPLTSNGKLDRSRLPEPSAREDAYVAPRGEIERAISRIWAEALRIERVGIHDNFFDLGGHSLLLTRVHARLRESLGADLPVIELFRFPTVAALAARLGGEGSGEKVVREHRERGALRREAARTRARAGARRAAPAGSSA